MLNLYTMDTDSPQDAQEELQKVRGELSLLYEISNAMRTTLKLDEILYIILTAVTAHVGLGFNRAMLFLVNEKDGILEGKMGIGPDSGEEANRIWTYLEKEKTNLDNLISNYKVSGHLAHSQFDHIVKGIRLPLKEEEGGILAMTLLDGMPLHITQETIHTRKQDTLINILRPEEFVTVPLKAKDKIIGVLFADNPYTHKPITKDNIRILTMFANQAGLAIENSKLYEQTLIKSHTDSLTSLWNHGYFQSRLQEEVSLAQKNKQRFSAKDLEQVFLDNWSSEGFISREHEERRLKTGKQALARFYKEQQKLKQVPYYVEESFTILKDDIRVRGRFDRVDKRGEQVFIIDFKSSDVRTQEAADKKAKDSMQLSIYALAWAQMFQVLPHRVELHFLDTGLIGSVQKTVKDLDKVWGKIETVAEGIRADNYKAKPSSFTCGYCAYSEVCPEAIV